MRIRKTAARNVHPAIAAIAIVFVLGVVQYVWWMKLVYRPPVRAGGGGGQGRGGGPLILVVTGLTDAIVETIAGAPEPGDSDGIGYEARFDGPTGIALDSHGAVYVADTRNNRVRVIDAASHTRTVAGSLPGYRDGPVKSALFDSPSGVAVSPDGTIYVADTNNHRIRQIRDGSVTTVAGSGSGLIDGPADKARFDRPTGLCWHTNGREGGWLLIADSGNHRVRRLQLTGGSGTVDSLVTVAGAPTSVSSAGSTIMAAAPDAGVLNVNGQAIPTANVTLPTDAPANTPIDLIPLRSPAAAFMSREGWYVVDTQQGAVYLVKNGSALTLAGTCQAGEARRGYRDGAGNRSAFGLLTSVAADAKGRVYVADCGNNAIRRITLPANFQP
jgi:DNA-binding beta-propeller fold protein YncE